jgi:hypothetical protein
VCLTNGMKSLENKQNNIMKTKSTMLAAGAGALLVAALCQTAQANSSSATLTELSIPANSFTVNSTATLVAGLWDYTYTFTPPSVLDALSIYFNTAAGAPITAVSAGGVILPGEIEWLFAPGGGPETLSFDSPIAPIIGYAAGFNGGEWGTLGNPNEASYGVEVPNAVPTVPDGGLTLALLGGSLVGLQALRRKLAR